MLDERIQVLAGGVSALLYNIDYDRHVATVEMDYSYLVEFHFKDVVIKVN